jgi:hypothetical protein
VATAFWIALLVVVIGAVAGIATIRILERRREELAAADAPSRRELAASRRHALEPRELRLLAPSQRGRYLDAWRGVEATFAGDPEAGIALADHMTFELASELGYPTTGFHDLAEELALDFPDEVPAYCVAHSVVVANERRAVSHRQLRRALKAYRTLYSRMVAPVQFVERERDTTFFVEFDRER